MTVQLASTPVFKAFDNNGNPLFNGQLFSYVAGTTTPQPTWTDSTQSQQNSNPVVLNARGEAQVWTDQTLTYKFVLADSSGNTIWTVDQVKGGTVLPTINQALLGPILYPQTAAELSASIVPTNFIYPPGNVLRYGITPNSNSAASTNTTALVALLNPLVVGPTGTILFPNTTGDDTYYFNNVIGVRDGVIINLQGCALQFNIVGSAVDSECGCFTAQRFFTLEGGGGTIKLNYTFTAGTDNGNVLMFGGRGADVSLFPPVYDSTMPIPMGNISVRNVNLNVTSTAPNSRCVFMLGGLANVVFENVTYQGNNSGYEASYYEFGWATQGSGSDESTRQTSHAHDMYWRNCVVQNFTFGGIDGNGAYHITIDGLNVIGTPSSAAWGVGEAMFYRPWNPTDLGGAKHGITLRNIVQYQGSGSAVILNGSEGISSSYLGNPWTASTTYALNATRQNGGNLYLCVQAGISAPSGGPTGTGTNITDGSCLWNFQNLATQTDLLDATVENLTVNGATGIGIFALGATRLTARHCTFTGCQKGVQTTTDTTLFDLQGLTILNSTSFGIEIGQATGLYSPFRYAIGKIKDCFIAGSTASGAIATSFVQSLDIENCRFGYEPGHDSQTETTQLQAVTADANSFNVRVKNCFVAGLASGVAFNLAAASNSSRGCILESISGVNSTSGSWLTDFESPTAQSIANNGTITTQAVRVARVTTAGAVTGVILQAGSAIPNIQTPFVSQEVTVVNESGNTLTFAASGTSNVADGVSDVIASTNARRFVWDTVTALWYPCK